MRAISEPRASGQVKFRRRMKEKVKPELDTLLLPSRQRQIRSFLDQFSRKPRSAAWQTFGRGDPSNVLLIMQQASHFEPQQPQGRARQHQNVRRATKSSSAGETCRGLTPALGSLPRALTSADWLLWQLAFDARGSQRRAASLCARARRRRRLELLARTPHGRTPTRLARRPPPVATPRFRAYHRRVKPE